GPFGTTMLEQLLSAGWHVVILARTPSKFEARANTTVVPFDTPEDPATLVAAMRGAQVVLCTANAGGTDAFALQKPLIDAAIAAGVKRFVPTEYAADMAHPKSLAAPVYEARRKVINYLKEKAAEGKIEYTVFHTGGLFEWGLKNGFLKFDLKARKAYIQDGGNDPAVASTDLTCARATVAALSPEHFASTANRVLRVGDASITQNQLLGFLEKATGTKWEVVHETSAENLKRGLDNLQRGVVNLDVLRDIIVAAVYTKDGSASWGEGDNKSIGLQTVDLQKVVDEVVKEVDGSQ
ncbi:NAD(P)-binding protein, partial [Auricularia subglabra TFB-10046 SS5]